MGRFPLDRRPLIPNVTRLSARHTNDMADIVRSYSESSGPDLTVDYTGLHLRRGATRSQVDVFMLTDGPAALTELYTARRQTLLDADADETTTQASDDTVDYLIRFIGLTGELPGAAAAERWHDKLVKATYHGLNASGVPMYIEWTFVNGVFDLIVDPT